MPEKKEKGYTHPALRGLSDSDLVSVYKTSAMRKLRKGDLLVQKGECEDTIYLILEGTAQVREERGKKAIQKTNFQCGDALFGATYNVGNKKDTAIVAVESLSTLVMPEQDFGMLPAHVQSLVYKNMVNRSQKRLKAMASEKTAALARFERLAHLTTQLLDTRGEKYSESEMIRGIIKGIPKLPMFANRLAVVILDENVSTRDVAELAKLDPSLVSIVLKTVNSSYYGFTGKISDFQHAVLLLGFNQVYQLVMDIGLRSTMPKTPAFRELFFHSMVVSFVSFEIAQMCQMEKAVAVSTIGLLHDLGKSVIMLLKGRHPKMGFLIDLLDPCKLGALLMEEWNIPEVVYRTLAYQSYPEWLPPDQIPQEHRKEVSALYLAHLCYDYLAGKQETGLPVAFLPEYLAEMKRPERSLRMFVEKVVLPTLKKKQKTFPEDVRDFITRGEQTLSEKQDETGQR